MFDFAPVLQLMSDAMGWLYDLIWSYWSLFWSICGEWIWWLIDPTGYVDLAFDALYFLLELLWSFVPLEAREFLGAVFGFLEGLEGLVGAVLFFMTPVIHPYVLLALIGAYMQVWVGSIILRFLVWGYGMLPGGQAGR